MQCWVLVAHSFNIRRQKAGGSLISCSVSPGQPKLLKEKTISGGKERSFLCNSIRETDVEGGE